MWGSVSFIYITSFARVLQEKNTDASKDIKKIHGQKPAFFKH